MHFWSTLRRRGLLIFLFSFCLSAVLLATKATSTESVQPSPNLHLPRHLVNENGYPSHLRLLKMCVKQSWTMV
jgi:hypothetical protein